MKVSNLKTISQYNILLENLNPRGKYQMRVFGICLLYWMFAGMYNTIFTTGYQTFKCNEALLMFETLGILIFAWFSIIKGRKVAMMFVQAFSFLGLILVLISLIGVFERFSPTIGISIIGFSVYTQPFLVITIVCELTTMRTIQIVCSLSVCAFCLGRIFIAPIVVQIIKHFQNPEVNITLLLLGPTCILSIIPSLYIYESPRYFIQKNIHKAEQLIRKVVLINTGVQGQVQIDQNFILKRIHLRKYNYFTLAKYNSFGYAQYCTIIVLFFLGILSYEPKYIFQQQKQQHIDTQIQIIWISVFEIIGAGSSIFFVKFCKRRVTCIFLSFLIAIVSTIFYSRLEDSNVFQDLVLLGLHGAFTISMFIFIVINCVQFYPHSIRTLGLAMMLSSYYIGQIFYYIYERIQNQPKYVLEMFMMASWLMLAHSFGQQQTLHKNLTYQIREIETQQKEQNQQNEEI